MISEPGRSLWETAGKLWTGRLATSSIPYLLMDGCLLVPDWSIGSKGILKFENFLTRGRPEGILAIAGMVLGDDTIGDAKG